MHATNDKGNLMANLLENTVLERKQTVIGATLIPLANNWISCQFIH